MKRATFLMVGAALLMTPVRACWWYPNITSLSPYFGPPRSLVHIEGMTAFATVLWDAGTPNERAIPGSFLGAWMISVPENATPGLHTIQLMYGGLRGTTAGFSVTAAVPFGAPRLDRVSLTGTEFRPANKVASWLYVQGANFDVGAEVLIDGVVQPSATLSALRNDLLGVDPTTLGNPIYHYLALLAVPGERNAGSTITVQVKNTDGDLSEIVSYTLPADAATMDSDGDDIPDQWEVNGYDAEADGVIDVDLAALGAHPFRPDLLVEVDTMPGLTHPPSAATFQTVRDAFAAAPFMNPAGGPGINAIFDVSGSVPFHQLLALRTPDNPATDLVNLYTLKAAHFDNAKRGRLFYYCVWGHNFAAAGSGNSDPLQNAAFENIGPGDDCVIAFDDFNIDWNNHGVRAGAETLMHELGHDLQQTHAGPFSNPDGPYNPAYHSVMTYSWQMRSAVLNNTFRKDHPVCAPFYYGVTDAAEAFNGGRVGPPYGPVTFSEGMGRRLNEAMLNELTGICDNQAVDYNGDTSFSNSPLAKDLNGDTPSMADDLLDDFPTWRNLRFGGPRLNGSLGT